MASISNTCCMVNCKLYRSQIAVHGAELPGLAARWLKYMHRCHSIIWASAIFMNRKS